MLVYCEEDLTITEHIFDNKRSNLVERKPWTEKGACLALNKVFFDRETGMRLEEAVVLGAVIAFLLAKPKQISI